MHEVVCCDDWIRDESDLVIGLAGMTIDIFPRRGKQIDALFAFEAVLSAWHHSFGMSGGLRET